MNCTMYIVQETENLTKIIEPVKNYLTDFFCKGARYPQLSKGFLGRTIFRYGGEGGIPNSAGENSAKKQVF